MPVSDEPFRTNALLAPKSIGAGRPSAGTLGWSLLLHVVATTVLLLIPAKLLREPDRPEPVEIVFYSPEEVEQRWIAPTEPEPVETVENVEIPAPPAPAPTPTPTPRIEHPVVPRRDAPVAVAEAREPEVKPRREVRTKLLADSRNAPAPRENKTPKTGGFAADAASDLKPLRRRTAEAELGGFTRSAARSASPKRSAKIQRAAFGGTASGDRQAPARSATVSRGEFGNGAAPAPAPRQRKRIDKQLDTPVEIVSKAKPVYTEKARNLRIEGEVVLEVTFVASGRLQVHRVTSGLGHGLNEAAVEAAKKIRFKPARRDGRPVDHTATLRVVFRLA